MKLMQLKAPSPKKKFNLSQDDALHRPQVTSKIVEETEQSVR